MCNLRRQRDELWDRFRAIVTHPLYAGDATRRNIALFDVRRRLAGWLARVQNSGSEIPVEWYSILGDHEKYGLEGVLPVVEHISRLSIKCDGDRPTQKIVYHHAKKKLYWGKKDVTSHLSKTSKDFLQLLAEKQANSGEFGMSREEVERELNVVAQSAVTGLKRNLKKAGLPHSECGIVKSKIKTGYVFTENVRVIWREGRSAMAHEQLESIRATKPGFPG